MTRSGYFMATCLAAMAAVAAIVVPTSTKLIWNATTSAPIGFYTVEPVDAIEVPDLVAMLPPEPFASFMVERGYVGRGVPLLKRVLGVPGQRVCRTGRTITVDAIEMGEALERDRMGRDLPAWQGCRVIAEGQIFLMNWEVRDSLDGRYFGALPASAIIGRAVPLYTDDDGSGRFVWHAQMR